MSVENLTEASPMPVGNDAGDRPKSKFANPMMWLQLIIFLAGLGLLFYVIYKIGFHTVTDALGRIGWGFLIIVALNGLRHCLRASCIYLAVPPEHRAFRFRDAFAARLGGEAVSAMTFTGPFLGDATKAALLKRNIPLSQGGAAVIVDNILYYTSVIIIILGGVGLMSFAYSNGKAMKYVLIGVTVFAVLIFIGTALLVWFNIKPLSWTIRKLSKRNLVPNFILKRQSGIFNLENNVHQFYLARRATFFLVFGLSFLAHILSVCEVYLALRMLGFESYLTTAYIIESLTKVINFAFSFVPGGVGVYEGGNGIILKSLGYTTAVGVTLALVRRGAILFWTFIGLSILLWRTVTRGSKHLDSRLS